jgi:hypothetical protein
MQAPAPIFVVSADRSSGDPEMRRKSGFGPDASAAGTKSTNRGSIWGRQAPWKTIGAVSAGGGGAGAVVIDAASANAIDNMFNPSQEVEGLILAHLRMRL